MFNNNLLVNVFLQSILGYIGYKLQPLFNIKSTSIELFNSRWQLLKKRKHEKVGEILRPREEFYTGKEREREGARQHWEGEE